MQAPSTGGRSILPGRLPALSGVEGSVPPLEAEVKAQMADANLSSGDAGGEGADPGADHRPARPAAMHRVTSNVSVKSGMHRVMSDTSIKSGRAHASTRLRHNNSAADLSSQPSAEHRPSHHRHSHHRHSHAHCDDLVVPEYGPSRGRTEQISPLSSGAKRKLVRLLSGNNTVVPTGALWDKSNPNTADAQGADEQGESSFSQSSERIAKGFLKLTQAPDTNDRRLMNRPVYDLATPEHENNCLCCYAPVIHPLSKLRNYWDFIVILLVIYTSLVLPVRTAFLWDDESTSLNGWTIMDITIDFTFLFDVILNFNTGFIREPDFVAVLSRKEIAKAYLKGWFWFDFLSSIPLDLVIMGQSNNAVRLPRVLRLIRAFRLLKILRLSRMVRYAQRLQIFAGMSTFSMRITKLFVFAGFFLHWNACFQYLVAAATGFPDGCWVSMLGLQDDPIMVRYTWAMFLATSQMFCIGYGPTMPSLVQEAWVMMLSYVGGAFIFAVFVGIITSVLISIDAINSTFLQQQEVFNQYMAHRKLPLDLRQRIRDSMDYKWRTRRALDEQSILNDMPSGLRSEVCLYICSPLIRKVSFFKSTSEGFVESLVLYLRPEVYLAMETIIRQGTQAKEMYFLNTGYVKVTANGVDVAEFGEGSHFGEIGILKNTPRIATCTAMNDCEVFVLTKQSFQDMLQDFPDYKIKFMEIAEERLHDTELKSKFPTTFSLLPGEEDNAVTSDGWTPPKQVDLDELATQDT